MLDGFRGEAAVDRAAIVGTLQRVSRLLVDFPEIAELDINPLLASSMGVSALDARVSLTAVS